MCHEVDNGCFYIFVFVIIPAIESNEVVTPNRETSSFVCAKPPEPDRPQAFINVAITSNQQPNDRFDHRMFSLSVADSGGPRGPAPPSWTSSFFFSPPFVDFEVVVFWRSDSHRGIYAIT